MEIAYIPVGVPTFDLDEAQDKFIKSQKMLRELFPAVTVPSEMLLSIDKLCAFLSSIHPDLVILQNITFANAEYASEVLSHTDCPVVLWTLREPDGNGGRLRLNSLTGAFSAGNAMHALGRPRFEYVFGAPDEKGTKDEIRAAIEGIRIKKQLEELTIAAVGYTPQGFGFGRALDADVRRTFGSRLVSIEARELIKKADTYSVQDIESYRKELKEKCSGIENMPPENIERYLRLRKAYNDFVTENKIGALASRCWPDFFTEYKTPVCAVLSMLNDGGIPSACEGDLYGALSMYIACELNHGPVFFGDPVAMDEKKNTITYWHCGMAAPSLAVKAELGVHPNRKIGPVMDFGCKASDAASVLRVGRKTDGTFRLFIASGKILNAPKQYQGTSVVFQPAESAEMIIRKTVKDGWEPHYVVAPSEITAAASCLAEFLGIEVCRF